MPEGRNLRMASSVVGTSFYHAGPALRRQAKGTMLALVPEPTNPHDRNAVRVLLRGQQVGHVPRTDAPAIRKIIEDGLLVACRLTGSPRIEVEYRDPKEGPRHVDKAEGPAEARGAEDLLA